MVLPARLRFGVFMAPFHEVGDNPTLALERDLELLQWLDRLGYDEAWIGEHHSGGWETIASPELFIATAAERTRHLMLGTGVISLPYHHPLMVANRMVLLDHLTRGRAMLGIGPGALISDAAMLGIDPLRQRPMMEEAIEIIVRLFTETEPFSYTSDWFQLHNALLQLRPYTRPHMPLAVASMQSPVGMQVAGRFGAAPLSLSSFSGIRGSVDLKKQWSIAEEAAEQAGRTMRREDWRLVLLAHVAESRRDAIEAVRLRAPRLIFDYFGTIVGRPGPEVESREQTVDALVERGAWVVGTPDDLVAAIHRFDEDSGGFGGLLIQVQECATRKETLRSYELIARYVIPQFQGSLVGLQTSARTVAAYTQELLPLRVESVERAYRAYEGQR